MDPDLENQYNSKEELIYAIGAACAMARAICSMAIVEYYGSYIDKAPRKNTYHTRHEFIEKIITSDKHCHNLLRMNVNYLRSFIHKFKHLGSLKDTIHYRVEEKVTIFLHILTHNQRVCLMKCATYRSDEIVGKYFNQVLDALLAMEDEFINPP